MNTSFARPTTDPSQLSLFDDLLAELNKAGGKLSTDQVTTAISKLHAARAQAKKRTEQQKAAAPKKKISVSQATSMENRLPVCIIILTDGYAPFPRERLAQDIPVLWLIDNDQVDPPWGKVARIKV